MKHIMSEESPNTRALVEEVNSLRAKVRRLENDLEIARLEIARMRLSEDRIEAERQARVDETARLIWVDGENDAKSSYAFADQLECARQSYVSSRNAVRTAHKKEAKSR